MVASPTMRAWSCVVLGVVLVGCEKSPPKANATATSASAPAPSTSVVGDDAQPPPVLCARLTILHNKVPAQISPIDPRECIQKFESAREIRPDLYACLSLCVMRADDFVTGAQCSGMCAPAENTCAESAAKKTACEAHFKALQADPTSKNIACVGRCGKKFDKLPDVVDCMGSECGL